MQTFLGLPVADLEDVAAGGIVILGVCDATPYEAGKASHSQAGPAAMRAASQRYAGWREHFDFESGGMLIDPANGAITDGGDIECRPDTPELNRANILDSVAKVLGAGSTPVVLGGDDSVPIPVLGAYEHHGPVWIVQVDAHMDWREERFGERLGWSSPMRRASEMAWVAGMVQVGLRGVGSALTRDIRDAKAWGSTIITAREVHNRGIGAAIEAIPAGARVFVSLDLDALDPAIMPGVMALSPGGLSYWHIIDLFDRLAGRARIMGCNIVELAPQRDPTGIAALTAARIVCHALASINRSQMADAKEN